jgi:hypothetical protein
VQPKSGCISGNRARPWHRTPILLVLLFLHFTSSANPVKKAYLLIKKGSLTEARQTLDKAKLKHKDDFGIDFVFSHYYLSPYQKTLSLDSAYFFCLTAIEKFRNESSSGKKRYENLRIDHFRIDSSELFSRKEYLDSLGFSKAQNLESESAYQWFLENFPKSRRLEEARVKRASLAFQKAREENSYQAFMQFLEKYPDAGEANTAKEISELMVFQNSAKKGKLQDWEAFLEKNPNNRYTLKAYDKIFQISTRLHTPDSYFQFVNKYPENPNTSKAWEWIFYLENSNLTTSQLAQKYPGFPTENFEAQARLRNLNLIPFIERGRFGWMDVKGRSVIRARFDSIPAETRCEVGNINFLKAFQKNRVAVFSMDSFPVSEGDYDDAEWFQDGIIKVFKAGKEGLVSLSGTVILDPRYESIRSINANLLSIKQGSKQFLFTSKGHSIEMPGVDEIIPSGSFLALRMGKKIGLITETEVLQSLENEVPKPDFRYTKIQKIGPKRLLLFEGDKAYYVGNNKISLIKSSNESTFTECAWGIQIENGGIISLVDSNGNQIGNDFERVNIVGNTAIVKSGGKFGMLNQLGKSIGEFSFDSLSQFYGNTCIGRKGSRNFLVFDSGKEIAYTGNKQPELLRLVSEKGSSQSYFISLSDSLGKKSVVSRTGIQVLPFAWDQINLIDQHLLSIQSERKYGLADTSGKILLKPGFSGISSVSKEFVCVAKGKSLYIINPYTQKILLSNLSGTARNFGKSKNLFIVRIQDKAGIVDNTGKQVVPCQYEDIMYWNPTRCLVKKNGFWYSYLLESGKELVKAIKKVSVLAERENEVIYEVESDGKVGIESTLKGEIAATIFDEIVPFEYQGGVCFFAGSRVQQSSVYTLIYIDSHGGPIKNQYLTEDEYERIVCD